MSNQWYLKKPKKYQHHQWTHLTMVKLYQNIHIRILRPITQHVKLTLIFGLGPTSTSQHDTSLRRLGCD